MYGNVRVTFLTMRGRDQTACAALGPMLTVSGRVVRVRLRQDGGWRVRLSETGGALAAAEIPPLRSFSLPRPGTRISIRGRICYDPVHGWYAVDPVEAWYEAREL